MAESEKDPCRIQIKDVRLSYPALFRPKGFQGSSDNPKYQASFIIDPESKLGKKNLSLIEDAIDAAKDRKWGDKPPKLKADKLCLIEGDPDKDEEDGMMVLRSSNAKAPLVLDRDKTELDESDGRPYGGCYVDAIVRIWAQDNEYGKRINGSLEAVRFRRDGEAFGAPPPDPDEFDDIDDDEDERPSRRSRSRDEDDEDDRSSRRRRSRDDDDDEDRPSRRRRGRDDDDDDDEDRPSKNSRARRSRDDEDEDDRPSRRRRSRDDDDEDERPRRRRSRDEDDDI